MTESTQSTIVTEPVATRLSAPEGARQQGVNPVDYLRRRGFVYDITDEDGLRAAFDNGPVTAYIGFDPTGTSLHAGHMVSIMLLATLQRMGHRPIALGGGGTAMVGDPTGKTSAREVITLEALEHNLAGIQQQLAKYLDYDGGKFGDNPAAIGVNNADWLLELAYIPFLRDIGKHFSVNEMLAIETYKSRLESGGLNFVEFNYRLVQAYDFLHLFRTEGCTLQMGGSDQWANITGGVELIRKADRGKAFALVSPLITTPSGEKMGKTGSGVRVWLDPDQFSPYEYYQYWVNTEDAMVETYLKQFTFLLDEEIADLTSVSGEALREAKQVLAFEATALAHGLDEAFVALKATSKLFSFASRQLQPSQSTSNVAALVPEEIDSKLAKVASESRTKKQLSTATPVRDAILALMPQTDMDQLLQPIESIAAYASIDLNQITRNIDEMLQSTSGIDLDSIMKSHQEAAAMYDLAAIGLQNLHASTPKFAEHVASMLESLSPAFLERESTERREDADDVPTTELGESELADNFTLADAFVMAGLAKSRGEARRLAQQGGLSVNEDKVSEIDVPFAKVIGEREAVLLRAGKKRFRRVVVA